MLKYSVIGPDVAGDFQVIYMTPGCNVPTVVSVCRNEGQAVTDALRRNSDQITRERALRAERFARGLGGVYPELEDQHGH